MAPMPKAGRQSESTSLKAQVAHGQTVAVSSGHALATTEALRVFKQTGNVIDAAIAGATVLAVVLPYACGIGGDMYLLYHDAGTGITHGLNGTGGAPIAADVDHFPDGLPQTGPLSMTVPGVVAAWDEALNKFGTRDLRETLAPAIAYAREGFSAHRGLIENSLDRQDLLLRNPEAAALYLPGGKPYQLDDPVIQEQLGHCLEQIARDGPRAFYEGAIAAAMSRVVVGLGGFLSAGDFERHRSLWQDAIGASFYGARVLTMPPNSVGMDLLLQLRVLEYRDIAKHCPVDPAFWRILISAWRDAKGASAELICDPSDIADVHYNLLQAQARLEQILKVHNDHIVQSAGAGTGDTSNLVMIDSQGNAVSLVQSISAPFGSGIAANGILLNNRMRGFNTRDGSTNCVGPGRRPAHSLVPTLVARGPRVDLSLGTPGAAAQTITLSQILTRTIALGQSMEAAVDAARWSLGTSDELLIEANAPKETINGLKGQYDNVRLENPRHVRFGSIKAAYREGIYLSAVADYRRVARAGAF